MTKRRRTLDVLVQKEAKLELLNQRSTGAVQTIIDTMDEFDMIEAEIAQTVSEIDEMQSRMSVTRAKLEARREHNARIRQNFKRLLDVE